MKNSFILLLLGFGLLTSGCTTYYFSTVESYHNRLPAAKDGYFSTTKNNIVVTYSFREYGGKVNYEVYNMSNDPVFIDLDKSTLIAEDYAIHQAQSASGPNESAKVYEAIAQNLSSDTTISAVNLLKQFSQSQNKLFVPPNSRTNFSPVSLYDLYNMRLPKQVYNQVRVGEGSIRGIYFTPANTPLMFRTYLTVVNGKDQSETVFEDIFYVSRAYKITSSHDILMGFVKQRGDTYYFSETNENAKLLGWTIAAVAIVAGAAALSGAEVVEETSY